MNYKTIFKGGLEFGNEKTFEKVLRMFFYRLENIYKNEVLLKDETVFDEKSHSLFLPRLIAQSNLKVWKNMLDMLEYLAQYAVTGKVMAWKVEDGKILEHHTIEPSNEKVAVQAYIRGKNLLDQGKEQEAIEALSSAIHRYERHALAYERRGFINHQLKNYDDAIYDFSKSIKFNPSNAESYIGRANTYIILGDYNKAVADLEETIKKSIPLEPIYWSARRLKAECFIKEKEYAKALQDLKLFSARHFTPENPNYHWRRSATFNYGKVLVETGQYKEAIEMFEKVLDIKEGPNSVQEAEILFYKGLARQKAGVSGYMNDWIAASDLGYEAAAKLIEQNT